jgi:hypothetical protein
VVVVDVSDPSHPAVVGTATLGGEIRDLVLHGAFAYAAADAGGLEIIDLSNPGAPDLIGGVRFQDRAYGVDAAGDYVYVAARSAETACELSRISARNRVIPTGLFAAPHSLDHAAR